MELLATGNYPHCWGQSPDRAPSSAAEHVAMRRIRIFSIDWGNYYSRGGSHAAGLPGMGARPA